MAKTINELLEPVREITFDFSSEITNVILKNYGEEKCLELIGEQLKQDFIKFLKQKQ